MTKKLILIGLFCLAGQQLVCQDTSNLRVSLERELINKQKEQLALEQKIEKQGEVVEEYRQKSKELYFILQEKKRDQMSDASLFRSIYYILPINPPGLKEAYEAEVDQILNSSFDDSQKTQLLTREQVYFFKFYSNKYYVAQNDLQALLVELGNLEQEISEIKNKLN